MAYSNKPSMGYLASLDIKADQLRSLRDQMASNFNSFQAQLDKLQMEINRTRKLLNDQSIPKEFYNQSPIKVEQRAPGNSGSSYNLESSAFPISSNESVSIKAETHEPELNSRNRKNRIVVSNANEAPDRLSPSKKSHRLGYSSAHLNTKQPSISKSDQAYPRNSSRFQTKLRNDRSQQPSRSGELPASCSESYEPFEPVDERHLKAISRLARNGKNCFECGKNFSKMFGLKRHLIQKHDYEREKLAIRKNGIYSHKEALKLLKK